MQQKKNKTPRFRVDIRFQNRVREQTHAAIMQQEKEFAQNHKHDTDEQLLAYVCAFSKRLGRTPNAGEIIGGRYISSRFQGWDTVVAAAKLPSPGKPASFENRLIYKEEYKRQEKLVREAYNKEKEENKAAREQKNAEGQTLVRLQQERDRLWGEEHETDTDEQLLNYIRRTAAELGHSPFAKEVEGATYIAKWIGSWALVLYLAGLPMPKGVEPPNPKTLKAYLQHKNAEKSEE